MQSDCKCVLVGDSGVGKTYLVYTYVQKVFPKEYIPCFFNSYSAQVNIDDRTLSLHIEHTAGSDTYDRLRPLSYNNTNVIIICFSTACPTSYENVKHKWLPEVKHYCPDSSILLVGTKTDLRDNQEVMEKLKEQNQTAVTQQQGILMAKHIKAFKYVECASIDLDGLDEVFDEAARAFLSHSATTERCCVLL